MTDQIIQFVTARTGVTYEEMKSPSRKREFVIARQAAMWLTWKHTEKTLSQIGRRFGGRDHSTVIHSKDAVDDSLSLPYDKTFKWVFEFEPNYTRIPSRMRYAKTMNAEEIEMLEICL